MKELSCSHCNHLNPPSAKFCQECGRSIHLPEDPLVGREIGNLRLDKRIGSGGMGVVYLAEHIHLGKPYAVKFLHPQYAGDKEVVERFRREARVIASLDHDNIIRETDFGWLDGVGFYFVMEYLQGRTLKDLIRKEGALPLRRVLSIFHQVLDALDEAHSKEVIHRDLKPENIFLIQRRSQEWVKILDFGIARIPYKSENAEEFTMDGDVYGSPTYMSPEQARGEVKEVDHRSDLYSVGIILIEALTGRPPFVGRTPAEIMLSHVTKPIPSLSKLRSDLYFDEKLDHVVQQALCKHKDGRFSSAAEFLEKLSKISPNSKNPSAGMTEIEVVAVSDIMKQIESRNNMTLEEPIIPLEKLPPELSPPKAPSVKDLQLPLLEKQSLHVTQSAPPPKASSLLDPTETTAKGNQADKGNTVSSEDMFLSRDDATVAKAPLSIDEFIHKQNNNPTTQLQSLQLQGTPPQDSPPKLSPIFLQGALESLQEQQDVRTLPGTPQKQKTPWQVETSQEVSLSGVPYSLAEKEEEDDDKTAAMPSPFPRESLGSQAPSNTSNKEDSSIVRLDALLGGDAPPKESPPSSKPQLPIHLILGMVSLALILGGVVFFLIPSESSPPSDTRSLPPVPSVGPNHPQNKTIATKMFEIHISSSPDGAEVHLLGHGRVGITPCTLQFPSGSRVNLILKKAGYQSRRLPWLASDNQRVELSLRKKP